MSAERVRIVFETHSISEDNENGFATGCRGSCAICRAAGETGGC
jgi:hypothetical protein